MTQQIFVNASQVVTASGPARARRGREMQDAGVMTDAAVAIDGDIIAAVGRQEDIRAAV